MRQAVLGVSGQIGQELAKALYANHTHNIRVVSRDPKPVNPSDQTLSANLLDPEQTSAAVAGTDVVYLTAGLPMDTARWVKEWPPIMSNVIKACKKHGVKLVFFDNTYMYPQTAEAQMESTRF
ncbi:MAG: NAD(P)H-binding protein, partial [Limnobacter sp.]|nr:NAD(P)H-binding protein [Limnobacter sp.]